MNANKMGVQPVPRLLLAMGLPMILSMIVQAFYNLVDSYFISNLTDDQIPNLGDLAMNALTLSFPIQMLMIAIGVGTGVGVGALLSKHLGQREFERANYVAGNAISVSVLTYVIFLLFGLFGTRWFLSTQTSDPQVLELGVQYLSICCVWSFGAVCSMIYEKLLQSTGKTQLSTIAQLIGAITNIILDPILIYGLLGLPKMGVTGAAVATVVGQILTLIADMIFHYRCNHEISGHPRYLRPRRDAIVGIYVVGAPAIVMQALMSVMSYGINIIYGMVSAAAVTAFGIYYKIQQFVFFAAFGMNNAMIPVIAYNFGRGDRRRIDQGILWGQIYTLILMLIGMAVLQIFAAPICGVFSLSAETEDLCIRAIRIVTLGYLFAGLNIGYQGVFQALGNGVKSLILSLVRLIVVTLPLAWALTRVEQAADWIWLCFPIAEACGVVVALAFMQLVARRQLVGLKHV